MISTMPMPIADAIAHSSYCTRRPVASLQRLMAMGREGARALGELRLPSLTTTIRLLVMASGATWPSQASLEEKKLKMRQRRWVHYPGAEEQNLDRDVFRDAERVVYREEKERRRMKRLKKTQAISLDLDKPENAEE